MTKDIKYSGLSAVPSDYECPDGSLAASLNLISEDYQLKPIFQPKSILNCNLGGVVKLIHHVTGQDNYIILRHNEHSLNLYWLEKTEACTTEEVAIYIATYPDIKDMAIVGNTLVISTSEGLRYMVWKDDNYICLANRPPFLTIDFGLYKVGDLTDNDTFDIPARCAPGYDSQRGQAEKTELAQLTQCAYGLLNPAIADKVTSKGFFYQPFFIRYAYRLYDGSYSWHSAPILMLPNLLPPLIKYVDDDSHPASDSTISATLTLNVPYFALAYRILTDGVDELAKWADIVAGVDIFISAPIYTYDQSKDLEWRPVRATRTLLGYICPTEDYENYSGDRGRPDMTLPSSVFIGHFADSINGRYIDHTMQTGNIDNPNYYNVLNIKAHENFYRNIQECHTFYKLAELDIKDISIMSEMAPLKFDDSDLSALVSRPALTDDYQSHCDLVASSLYSFNSRLNLAGVELAPAKPFAIRSMMQFGNPDDISASRVRITVWTRINGKRCCAVHTGDTIDSDIWYSPTTNFPRYIFYPDASAYKMEIYISDNQKYIVNLKPHDFLNGAYYFLGKAGLGKNTLPTNAEPETAQCETSVSVGSKIYTSEINNPFFFPLLGINTVGTGTILGISTAAKALSQGQFGQFPLYAFTSEGVWALEVSSSGSYTARQPITRDVCINPDSITQLDSAVLFATDRGIMMISGSVAQPITDVIKSEYPYNISQLSGLDKLHSMIGHGHEPDTCFPMIPLRDFLATCGMIYDYQHQRLIVYKPNRAYAYVYSFRSQQWGMMHSNINKGINSYPEALAMASGVDSDNNPVNQLVDFSTTDETVFNGLFVTRPIKLETPDVLKTITAVIQRGHFRKGAVKCILYGSRDLYNWHLIWSSKDHYLRGFRGTPYKYFRIACVTSLAPGESIFGASIDFEPRLTNQLR